MAQALRRTKARIGRISLWVNVAVHTHQYRRAIAGIFREVTLQGQAIV